MEIDNFIIDRRSKLFDSKTAAEVESILTKEKANLTRLNALKNIVYVSVVAYPLLLSHLFFNGILGNTAGVVWLLLCLLAVVIHGKYKDDSKWYVHSFALYYKKLIESKK